MPWPWGSGDNVIDPSGVSEKRIAILASGIAIGVAILLAIKYFLGN